MNVPGIVTIPLSGNNLAEAAARHLLACHAGSLPDLSNLVVLVPNQRAVQDFAQHLAACSGLHALIPPAILPLKSWADSVADGAPEAHASRLARLHATLRKQAWLGHIDHWALADELLNLSDALEAERPEQSARRDFSTAYAPSREIALVEAVHTAFSGSATNPVTRYAAALKKIAASADKPLFVFAPGPLTQTEKYFLNQYARKAPVTLFELATDSPVAHCLHAAWQASGLPIRERAQALAELYSPPPLQNRLKLAPAPHLEAEARAATAWVMQQLQEGRGKIALIALDRLTARRVRALLERLDVLVEDETGWTFTTTAAAAVIDRWLECLASDFPHVEVLDLLKSPFLLGDLAARQDTVLKLELAMRRHGIHQGRAELWKLAQSEPELAEAIPLLDALLGTAQAFPMRRATLAEWLQRLRNSLAALRAIEPLGADAAGAQLLEKLDTLQHELAATQETHSFGEWRRWLDWVLESATFADKSVASPVVLTSLPNTRGRVFDAVAILGADATHLPAPPASSLLGQSALASLGLPTTTDHVAQTREDLIQLLAQGNSLLTWQAWKEDAANPPSPFIALLQTLHQAAWHTPMDIQHAATPPAKTDALPQAAARPAPVIPASRLPLRYSPTAYQTLIDCPYRFFARHALGLKELDEADQELDKSDYGNALHRILKRFHDSAPPRDAALAQARLDEIAHAEFSAFSAWTAIAWQARWHKHQTAYIALWLQHAHSGWHYQSGEKNLEMQTHVPELGEITLSGRVDRIDTNGTHTRVLDYKTTHPSKLKKWAEHPGEHVQLPFYAWLAEAEAAYLPIDTDEPRLYALDEEVDPKAIAMRLPELLEKVASGTPLIANGAEAVCGYCEARGLCRKGWWHE